MWLFRRSHQPIVFAPEGEVRLSMNSRLWGLIVVLALSLACNAQSTASASTSGESDQGSPSQRPLTTPSQTGKILGGRLIHKEDPKYPKEARKQKLQGQVLLQAVVEEDGHISMVSLISGEWILGGPAKSVVHRWKFEPFTQNGHPVRVQQKLVLNFTPTSKAAELELPLPEPSVIPLFVGPGVYRVGGAVSPPRALYSPNAEYSEEARRAKYEGVCVLSVIVGPDGLPQDIKVARSLGMGLDEKAIEAVKQWRFKPAMKDGMPVAVAINVEVNFRL